MKGINPLTESVNPLTGSVQTTYRKPRKAVIAVTDSIQLSDLISIKTFLSECWLTKQVFRQKRQRGDVEGLIEVAGRRLVNRKAINMRYRVGGDRFRRWIELGGRFGAVSVKDGIAFEGLAGKEV